MRRVEKYFQTPTWKREVVWAESERRTAWNRTWVKSPTGSAQVKGNVNCVGQSVLAANVHRTQTRNHIIFES